MLLFALLLLEAQLDGDLKQKSVALKVTAEEWSLFLRWRAQACQISELNISLNQLLRLGLLHQGSGEERISLAPIHAKIRRRTDADFVLPRRVTLTMNEALWSHMNRLSDRSGGTNTQVVVACAELMMMQLEQERAEKTPRKRGATKLSKARASGAIVRPRRR